MIDLAAIDLVVLDVDGVLTDGSLHYSGDGETLKAFNSKDGFGIKALRAAGVEVAIISGRDSAPLRARLDDLGVVHAWLGQGDKAAALAEVLEAVGGDASRTLAMGDDVPDLAMLENVAIAACPADAHPRVRRMARWITARDGGAGAVREVADAVLAARSDAATAFHVVIPSRYNSTRLPGKPLRLIAGRPMIAHVWDRAVESGAATIVVATDDERIAECVAGFGGDVEMTASSHESGSDRIAEVTRKRGWSAGDIVVNLQGDEPAMPSENIEKVASALAARPWSAIATLATPIDRAQALFDPNTVKVVLDGEGHALLFSRAPIPFSRDLFGSGPPAELPTDVEYLRHLGLYAYRVGDLARLAAAAPVAIELTERLEQLRALALRLDIHVTIVKKAPPDGVDTENDLERIERFMTS